MHSIRFIRAHSITHFSFCGSSKDGTRDNGRKDVRDDVAPNGEAARQTLGAARVNVYTNMQVATDGYCGTVVIHTPGRLAFTITVSRTEERSHNTECMRTHDTDKTETETKVHTDFFVTLGQRE
ncbi:hypothetical protein MRX96_024321 [Rhipicephalus microplus]